MHELLSKREIEILRLAADMCADGAAEIVQEALGIGIPVTDALDYQQARVALQGQAGQADNDRYRQTDRILPVTTATRLFATVLCYNLHLSKRYD